MKVAITEMTERGTVLSQLLVVGHKRDGRSCYDREAKRELIEASLQPGASVARDQTRAALWTDGYEPYNEVARANELIHLGCWAHARRYLIEAAQSLPKERRAEHPVTGFLTHIGLLAPTEN